MSAATPMHRGLTAFGLAFFAIAGLYLAVLGLATRAQPWFADGYDGIGFVLAISDFDLARFQPQPPGFPLFVLLGRGLLALLGVGPSLACALVSALLLAAGLSALCALLLVQLGGYAALLFGLLVAPNTLLFGLGVATLSDGAGLGATLLGLSLAAWALHPPSQKPSRRACCIAGLLAGLALGVRPQAVTLLVLGLLLLAGLAARRGLPLLRPLCCFAAALVLGTLLWLLPLLACVGPGQFFRLCLGHARGHLSDFGGGLLTPTGDGAGLSRLGWAHLQALSAALGPGLTALALFALPLMLRRREPLPAAIRVQSAAGLAITLAYVVYVALFARVLGNGRHLAPLPVGLAVALVPLLAVGLQRRGLRLGLLCTAALLAVFSTRQVYDFRQAPSPGAQLVAGLPDCSARLYGAAAARFYDLRCGSGAAQPALYLGEVLSDLERRSNLPAEVLVTSEVIASPASQARLRLLSRACLSKAVPASLRFFTVPLLPALHAAAAPSRSAGAAADCVSLLAYRVLP